MSTPETTPPRTGRPTHAEAAQLGERLREAALAVFLDRGFDRTTMDAVARAAGVTRRTLYGRYPDKDTLFEAVVGWALLRWTDPVPDVTIDDPDEALLTLARSMLAWALEPDLVRLNRLAMAEAARFPTIAQDTQMLTWRPRKRAVMRLLHRHVDAGRLVVDDIECAAEHFLSMVLVMPARLATFGVTRPPEFEDEYLRRAVVLFLNGVRAPAAPRD